MALSKTTQDHDEIRQWAEKRGAKPAEVAGTHTKGQTGILRFCFPDAPHHNDAALREISWDEFFEKFDQNNLELIYQDVTAEGAESNFNKLIYPGDEHAHHPTSHTSSATTHKSSGSASHKASGASHTSTAAHSTHSSDSHSGKSSSKSSSSGKSSTGARSTSAKPKSSSSGSHSTSSASSRKSGKSTHKAA